MNKKIICIIFCIFCCVVFGFCQNVRTIKVSGSGSVKILADRATLTFSVITKEKNAIDSVQHNAQKMNNVYAALKEIGVEEKNISTSGDFTKVILRVFAMIFLLSIKPRLLLRICRGS